MARAVGEVEGLQLERERADLGVHQVPRAEGVARHGGAHLARSIEAAAVGGRISLIGVLDGFELAGQIAQFARKKLTLDGIQVGPRSALEQLVRAVETTGISPVVDAEYALEDLPSALAHLDRGVFGKVVVRVG
ncbi:zinc-binding alcohol dehydrogenase family protein [Pseudonocardia hierapolitana]|uniref:Zinc-binding alcohol dehydrogenase family protein n=1 Tax=Pseudonocardia hierapolitana TaxID=1128676 RepID=A0A561SLY2_9PSEU|nr:zinc-binding dehydrogenase [Pseudonocardia hierapolitana]TWF75878.1 zinc-binding alcohol dehydrogenase family protein [Pseudonocardia hierapolitana]